MSEKTPSRTNPSLTSPQEEWETVTFPNATSVEELTNPRPGSDNRQDPPVQPSLVSGDSFIKVQQHNQELRDQVAALDSALLRSRHALRAEMERWEALALAQTDPTESSETQLQNQRQEFSGSQARLGDLFVELEQSHRMAQRQQILVETLMDQLQHSHEQIAQLERECASAQARSSEQTQLLLQSEHTGRDLRSRLHRQQRYTLQFKAALEKCLDVPPATAQGFVADLLTADVPESPASPVKLNIPRSQPVQPWSAVPESEAKSDPAVLQTWANAVVVNTVTEEKPEGKPEVESEVKLEIKPENQPDEITDKIAIDDRLEIGDSAQLSASNSPEPSDSLDPWESVLAQVQAIVGEDAKIVESIQEDPMSDEDVALEEAEIENDPILNKIKDIAPVINPGRSPLKKRESLAAVELPSFGRRV